MGPYLCDHIALRAHKLEADLVRHNGGVAVRNVGEGPGVHQNGRLLQRLQQGWRKRILHQHRQGASQAQVVSRHRFPWACSPLSVDPSPVTAREVSKHPYPNSPAVVGL